MLTTKDLIESLSKYPDGTEWEIVGARCIASELGVIDLEAMVGNDLSSKYELNKTKAYIEAMKEGQRSGAIKLEAEKLCESYDTDRKVKLEIPMPNLEFNHLKSKMRGDEMTNETNGDLESYLEDANRAAKVKYEDAMKLLDRSIDECLYVGVTSHVKDQQKLMNTSMSDMVDSMSIMKDFNDWFNNYSFAYVPKFCKPLIKGWLFDAYKAGVKSNDK